MINYAVFYKNKRKHRFLRGELRTPRSLQVARGTSRDVRHDVAFRLRMKWERQYRFITEIIHYPLHITNYSLENTHYTLKIDFRAGGNDTIEYCAEKTYNKKI